MGSTQLAMIPSNEPQCNGALKVVQDLGSLFMAAMLLPNVSTSKQRNDVRPADCLLFQGISH
jgi:hypothetical protein